MFDKGGKEFSVGREQLMPQRRLCTASFIFEKLEKKENSWLW
jgi:hypothetical protein